MAHGLGRVSSEHCVSEFGCTEAGAPISEYGGPGIVQATQGSGPAWLKREFVQQNGQNMQ